MSRRQRARACLVALVVAATALVPSAAAWADDEEPTYTVSGVFTTNLTSPFKADYSAVNAWDHDGEYVNGVLLDPDGSYSLDLPEGTYNFQFTAYAEEGIDRYQIPSVHTTRRDVQVFDDMTLNVFDDEPALTVHLVDPEGDPIPGYVSLSCQLTVDDWPVRGDQDEPYEVVRRMDDFAEGTGDLVVRGFDVAKNAEHPEWRDGCELVVYPDQGTRQYHDVLLPDAENEITVTVEDPVTLSGHISMPRGEGTAVYANALDAQGRYVALPDGWIVNGDYRFNLSPGTYTLEFDAETDPEDQQGDREVARWRVRGVVVNNDMTYDAKLDAVPVTVNLVDVNGDPVAGAASLSCRDHPVAAEDGYYNSLESKTWGTGQVTVYGMPDVEGEDGAWQYCRIGYQRVWEEGVDYNFPGNEVTIRAGGPNEFTLVTPFGPALPGGYHASTDPDGVEDIVEAGALGGDGNSDGLPDFLQDNVTSLPANGLGRSDGVPYVTIASPEGFKLADVSTMPTSAITTPPPAGVSVPFGLTSFTLTGITPGSTQTVWAWIRPQTDIDGWAKYDPDTGVWSMLPADRFVQAGERVEITLTDGGIGDSDGVADGRITDPGGFAMIATGDTTPPTVTGRATTRPNGAGWYRGNVRIDWTATDPSGVRTQPADTIVSTEGASVTAMSPLVCDKVTPTPNCGRGTLTGLKIDKTSPALAVAGVANGATYTLGNVPTPSCVASDALSGLASPCKGVKAGGNSAGVGAFTYAMSVADKAGNVHAAAASYRVAYRFDGFAQPVNDPGPPVSIFKAGSTVPVAFTLKRNNGTTVSPASRPVWVSVARGARTTAPVNEAVSTAKGTTGSSFVLRSGAWHYDWSTKGLASGYLYRIGVRLDDGTTHYVTVGVR